MASPSITVTDSRGAYAADAAAIAAGTPSRALMQRAGAAAAAEIATRLADRLSDGVVVATGAGNNGGDGWVIARALHATGATVRVVECAESRTPDAQAERALAVANGVRVDSAPTALLSGGERIVVDALLGTGYSATTPLRADMVESMAHLRVLASRGASVVALDVPSGLDATSGVNAGHLVCSLTLSFGTIKRGQLIARDACGSIVLLDIGLGTHAAAAGSAQLASAQWFHESLPADVWWNAQRAAGECDVLLVVGTSAVVYPAASLIPIAKRTKSPGATVIECNLTRTEASAMADIGLYGPSGETLPKVCAKLGISLTDPSGR